VLVTVQSNIAPPPRLRSICTGSCLCGIAAGSEVEASCITHPVASPLGPYKEMEENDTCWYCATCPAQAYAVVVIADEAVQLAAGVVIPNCAAKQAVLFHILLLYLGRSMFIWHHAPSAICWAGFCCMCISWAYKAFCWVFL